MTFADARGHATLTLGHFHLFPLANVPAKIREAGGHVGILLHLILFRVGSLYSELLTCFKSLFIAHSDCSARLFRSGPNR